MRFLVLPHIILWPQVLAIKTLLLVIQLKLVAEWLKLVVAEYIIILGDFFWRCSDWTTKML